MKVPSNREEWIRYLVKQKAVPIWSDYAEGNVYFRRLTGPTSEAEKIVWGKHILGKKTRQSVARILGIVSESECKRVRELIKEKIRRRE